MGQKEIHLPAGLDPDTAADVLQEYARYDEPTMNEADTLEALRDEVAEAKEAFAAVLAEQSPQSADTLSRQDMDALTEPFRDDEGAIDVDTLQQQPETQSTTGTDSDDGDTEGFQPDALSLSDREELRRLKMKRTSFANRGMGGRVDTLNAEIRDLAGVDDADDIDWEAL